MPAMANQQISAFAQSRRQIESRNAATGPAPLRALSADDNRGPIELVKHARSDNTNYADVPEHLALDDDKIIFGFEFGSHGRNGFFSNAALDFLALAILGVQLLSERHR